jgi:spore germination cell wall hydrolase CwlJ-like protein
MRQLLGAVAVLAVAFLFSPAPAAANPAAGAVSPTLGDETAPTLSQPLVAAPPAPSASVPAPGLAPIADAAPARSLADLVYDHSAAEAPDAESDCLARAVYWEAKGEPLSGQLAVARVIINRARSGRFADTYCGVVRQRSQFSFVHGGLIPSPPQASPQWRTAVAIARIAIGNLTEAPAPDALFFHARSVRPGWRLTRLAAIGNHVFYR